MPNLFDPIRETYGGRPCFIRPDGKPGPPIPALVLQPTPDARWLVQIPFETEHQTFSLKGLTCEAKDIPGLMEYYLSDPEDFCKHRLGVVLGRTYIKKPAPRKAPEGWEPLGTSVVMSLEDLGL